MAYDGGTAIVHVVADATSLNASLAGVTKRFASLKSAVSPILQAATGAGSAIGSALSVGATVGAAALAALTIKGVSDFQTLATEVRTLEKQLGLTAEQASEFHAQATALGLSVDKLSVGFGIFSKNLTTAAPALEKFGITAVRTAAGQVDFNATLDEVRAKFQALPAGVDRTSFALQLFGRSGKALIPFLSASSEELQTFTDNAKAAGLIMSENDVQAARSLGIAQRELGEAFRGVEVSLARAVIPLLTDAANAIAGLVRAVSPLLPLLRDLGVIWLAYRAYMFIPALLTAISNGLFALAAATGSAAIDAAAASVAVAALSSSLLPIVGLVVAATGAILSMTGVIQNFADAIDNVITDALTPFAGAAAISEASGLSMAKSFDIFNKAAAASPDGVVNITDVLDNLTTHVGQAGNAVRNFGGLTRKHLKEFKQAVVESVQVSIGQFKNVGEAFTLTATQLKNQANAAVKVAQQEHKDLQAIFGSKDLTDKQKQALANLAPDQRHAWAEAGKAGRAQITADAVKLANLNAQTFRQVTHAAAGPAKEGGKGVSEEIITGAVQGLNEGSGLLASTAFLVVQNAIAAMRDAAQVKSPSRLTDVLGQQIVMGLIQGMHKQETALARQASKLIDLIKKALGDDVKDISKTQLDFGMRLSKQLEQAGRALDKLKSKLVDFKNSIKAGFSTFADLGSTITQAWADNQQALKDYQQALADFQASGGEGTAPTAPPAFSFSTIIADQVAQAQRLAKDLTDAAKAGLSKGLLAQFASQGAAGADALEQLLANPELIDQLNQASKDIQKAAGQTAEALGDKFFATAVKHASNHLDHLSDALVRFIARLQRMLGDVSAGIQAQLNAIQAQAQAAAGGGGGAGGGGTPHLPGQGPGGGGGGGHGGKPQGHGDPNQTPPTHVTVNVHGWVGNDQDIASRLRNELLRVGRNNGGTGL